MFAACGAPVEDAAIVAEELVEASLMGLDSHGVVRYIQYVDEVLRGRIKPGSPVRIVNETPSTAVVDCGFNFGPVSARKMVTIVTSKAAQSNVAFVVSLNSHHISRLGSCVQKIAEQGMFGFATCNSSKHGHWVVPWGGREGRLATNPLAYAAPTSGWPVVMDMSTAMIAEGKIRILMNQGEDVPDQCILDANGNPTNDPADFYGPPHGTILPLGSQRGYKGFGLGLLVEILSGIIAGMATSMEHPCTNGLAIMALNPGAFCGVEQFRDLMDDLSEYMTTTPPAPGFDEVVMPGTYDFRMREKRLIEGIPLDSQTWSQIVEAARRVGITVGAPSVRETSTSPVTVADQPVQVQELAAG